MKMKNMIIMSVLTLGIFAQAEIKLRGADALKEAQEAFDEPLVVQSSVSEAIEELVADMAQTKGLRAIIDELAANMTRVQAAQATTEKAVVTLDGSVANVVEASKKNSDAIKAIRNPKNKK